MYRLSFAHLSAVVLTLALVISACAPPAPSGAGQPAATTAPAKQAVQFRVASANLPPAPVLRCGMETLRNELQGTFDVRVFHSAQLGQAAQVLQLVKAGEFEASMVGPGQLQAFYAPMGIFSAIYVIDDHEHMRKVMGS